MLACTWLIYTECLRNCEGQNGVPRGIWTRPSLKWTIMRGENSILMWMADPTTGQTASFASEAELKLRQKSDRRHLVISGDRSGRAREHDRARASGSLELHVTGSWNAWESGMLLLQFAACCDSRSSPPDRIFRRSLSQMRTTACLPKIEVWPPRQGRPPAKLITNEIRIEFSWHTKVIWVEKKPFNVDFDANLTFTNL